jgi:methylmalonyl-CoA mutase N-terminal domain/subunit
VANTVDPAGGSYEIESRTNAIERDATALLRRIEAAGGTLAAIASGMIQKEIHESAYKAQRAIDNGDSPVVGVTTFQTGEGAAIPTFRIDPDVDRVQRDRVLIVRRTRDAGAWRASLDAIRDAARGDANLMPLVIAAVCAYATVGEISDTLREVFGEAPLV